MNDAISTPHQRRWFLIVLTALFALFQIVSVLRVLQIPDELAARLAMPVVVEFIAGLWWAALFTLASVSLVQRWRFALRYTGWVFVAFVLYSLARLAIFARADYDRQRIPFLLVVMVIIFTIGLFFRTARFRTSARETVEDGIKLQD